MNNNSLNPADQEIKQWIHQDALNYLAEMGYESYDEYLYEQMMEEAMDSAARRHY